MVSDKKARRKEAFEQRIAEMINLGPVDAETLLATTKEFDVTVRRAKAAILRGGGTLTPSGGTVASGCNELRK